jgi:hypothetical protein
MIVRGAKKRVSLGLDEMRGEEGEVVSEEEREEEEEDGGLTEARTPMTREDSEQV